MPIEKLIELLQAMSHRSVALDCTTGIFDHRMRPSLDGHLSQYDGWMCATVRIVTPPRYAGQFHLTPCPNCLRVREGAICQGNCRPTLGVEAPRG